jgi:hypothetical protein
MSSTVRFSQVLEAAGEPGVYLPLNDPGKDKAFNRAKEENRVLSLKQIPTGTKKDFGLIGALDEKFITYLIFPKSLARFKGKRVVGIKYEELEQSPAHVSFHGRPKLQKKIRKLPKTQVPKLPKRFTVRIQLVAKKSVEVSVEAHTTKEARVQASRTAIQNAAFSRNEISPRVLSARPRRR